MAGPQPRLLICTQAVSFDKADGTPAILHEGAVVLDDHPVVKGREGAFRPLVIVVAGDRHQPPADVLVMVTGENAAEFRQYIRMQTAMDTPPGLRG